MGSGQARNRALLTDILRGEWGFGGLVMTDFFWGLRDPVGSVAAGQDLEMPFSPATSTASADGVGLWSATPPSPSAPAAAARPSGPAASRRTTGRLSARHTPPPTAQSRPPARNARPAPPAPQRRRPPPSSGPPVIATCSASTAPDILRRDGRRPEGPGGTSRAAMISPARAQRAIQPRRQVLRIRPLPAQHLRQQPRVIMRRRGQAAQRHAPLAHIPPDHGGELRHLAHAPITWGVRTC